MVGLLVARLYRLNSIFLPWYPVEKMASLDSGVYNSRRVIDNQKTIFSSSKLFFAK